MKFISEEELQKIKCVIACVSVTGYPCPRFFKTQREDKGLMEIYLSTGKKKWRNNKVVLVSMSDRSWSECLTVTWAHFPSKCWIPGLWIFYLTSSGILYLRKCLVGRKLCFFSHLKELENVSCQERIQTLSNHLLEPSNANLVFINSTSVIWEFNQNYVWCDVFMLIGI